jgi:hypothetical protein
VTTTSNTSCLENKVVLPAKQVVALHIFSSLYYKYTKYYWIKPKMWALSDTNLPQQTLNLTQMHIFTIPHCSAHYTPSPISMHTCIKHWQQLETVMHQSMLCPTLGRAGIHWELTWLPCFWVGDLNLFDIKEAPQGRAFWHSCYQSRTFSQARPTSWHVSGKFEGEFMNSITSFAAF